MAHEQTCEDRIKDFTKRVKNQIDNNLNDKKFADQLARQISQATGKELRAVQIDDVFVFLPQLLEKYKEVHGKICLGHQQYLMNLFGEFFIGFQSSLETVCEAAREYEEEDERNKPKIEKDNPSVN